jgi:hypothetical protein
MATLQLVAVAIVCWLSGIICGLLIAWRLISFRKEYGPSERCHYCGGTVAWPFPYYGGRPICTACLSRYSASRPTVGTGTPPK